MPEMFPLMLNHRWISQGIFCLSKNFHSVVPNHRDNSSSMQTHTRTNQSMARRGWKVERSSWWFSDSALPQKVQGAVRCRNPGRGGWLCQGQVPPRPSCHQMTHDVAGKTQWSNSSRKSRTRTTITRLSASTHDDLESDGAFSRIGGHMG